MTAGSDNQSLLWATPPSSFLRTVREELASSSTPKWRRVVEVIDVSGYLACRSVFDRQRAAGRLMVRPAKLSQALLAIKDLGLAACAGETFCQSAEQQVEGTEHAGKLLTDAEPSSAWAFLYFALDEELAEGAMQVEQRRNDELFGRLLGYPECCIQAYVAGRSKGHDRTACSVSSLGPFPSLLNPALQPLYGIGSPIFHFPCSLTCAKSLALAQSRLADLATAAPSASRLAALGAGLAIYGPTLGIALVTKWRDLGRGRYELRRLVSRSETSRNFFGRWPRPVVCLETPHRFTFCNAGPVARSDTRSAIAVGCDSSFACWMEA